MSVTIRCVVQVRAIASFLLAKCERSIGQKAVVAATLIVVYKGASLYCDAAFASQVLLFKSCINA